jgi:hypothetical protein
MKAHLVPALVTVAAVIVALIIDKKFNISNKVAGHTA